MRQIAFFFKKQLNWEKLPYLFLACVFGILPLIVYMRMVEYDDVLKALYHKQGKGNFFTFYKSLWLIVFVFSSFLWFALNRKIKESKFHSPMVIYLFLAVLSSMISKFPSVAFLGDAERFEGFFVLLCYMGIVFLVIQLIDTVRKINFLLSVLLLSAGIISIIGALQFFGFDYFAMDFADRFLIPQEYKSFIKPKTEDLTEGIIITFGNANFTGFYMGMILPICFFLFVLSKKSLFKIFAAIVGFGVWFNLLISNSRAGFFSGILAILIGLIIMRKKAYFLWKPIMIFVLGCFLCFSLVKTSASKFSNFKGLAKPFKSFLPEGKYFGKFENLQLNKESAKIVFDGILLKIAHLDGELKFFDKNDQKIEYKKLEWKRAESILKNQFNDYYTAYRNSNSVARKNFSINDKEPLFLILSPAKITGYDIFVWPDESIMQIRRGNTTFFLKYTNKGFRFLSPEGVAVNLREVPSFGFEGYERFASARGYIWSRSLPLLKKTVLLGFGPDNFPAYFPNYDYIGKLRHLTDGVFRIVDKPHSFYLQTALNTGFVSLLALIYVFYIYISDSLRLLWNSNFSSFEEFVSLAFLSSVVAYLVAAIFNDSVVSVSPIFWGILGLGIAVNRMILKKESDPKIDQVGC